MNWVYRTIQINKVAFWIIFILFILMWIPITLMSLIVTGSMLHVVTNVYSFDFSNIYVNTLFFLISWVFVMALFYYTIVILPVRSVWARDKSNSLFNNWHNHKNIIGKDLYHLLEFYNIELNFALGIVEKCLNEIPIKYKKQDYSATLGNFRRRYKYWYYYLVFPLLGKIFPTSIKDFYNGRYRSQLFRVITFHLPDNKLYLLVGNERVGNPFIPIILSSHNAIYVQICGVNEENETLVQKLETKITEKLKQNPDIRFLSPGSTQEDMLIN
ncbi:MAG: hypothetical protein CVT88_02900 [Candidatus Altiarchaeales archaeon HGW-Altiarchaeales-1]|nr:MAG: hypothetical protein CVT88_02900 [Candidatus Altiarchaeales archaeon HGW-Altiarchaeales-1]